MRSRLPHIFLTAVLCMFCLNATAQFREEAFTQSYNNDKTPADSVDKMFSFKEYFGGLRHKEEIKIGTSFAGSMLCIGGMQIYNKDYWKLPLVYGGLAATVGTGIYFNSQGRNDVATWCYAGAGLVYWGTLMDGVVSYKPSIYPHAGKATLYSLLCPGLGQIYNHELWKTPIYIGGLVAAGHFYSHFRMNYERFRDIYNEASDPNSGYSGGVSASTALYYRNTYRRYRDYSMLAMVLVYVLQIIDANVFSYMHDFSVDDDMAISVSPTIITTDTQYALNPNPNAFGVRFGLRF